MQSIINRSPKFYEKMSEEEHEKQKQLKTSQLNHKHNAKHKAKASESITEKGIAMWYQHFTFFQKT